MRSEAGLKKSLLFSQECVGIRTHCYVLNMSELAELTWYYRDLEKTGNFTELNKAFPNGYPSPNDVYPDGVPKMEVPCTSKPFSNKNRFKLRRP